MILTEKVINKYMIDDKITKEHIEHLRDINYYDALKLFDMEIYVIYMMIYL